MVRGRGCHLFDEQGRAYLDMTGGSGAVNLGHQHPEVVSTLKCQAEQLIHTGWNIDNPFRHRMISQLEHVLPYREASVMGAVTGAEAVEVAIKIARKKTRREPILYFSGSFHGKTQGALSITSNDTFRDLLAVGLRNNPTFSVQAYQGQTQLDGADWGEALRVLLREAQNEGRLPAAAIIEPVQAAEGIHVVRRDILKELLSVCAEFDVLSVFDEIYTGLGRTGQPFVASQDLCPDIVVLGKSLGNGLPVSAVAGPPEIVDVLSYTQHSSTFTFMPLACAVASKVLELHGRQDQSGAAARSGAIFTKRLRALADTDDRVSGVRGIGLMLAFDFVGSAEAGRLLPGSAAQLAERLLHSGVIVRTGGTHGTTVKLTPPLIFDETHMGEFFAALDSALNVKSLH